MQKTYSVRLICDAENYIVHFYKCLLTFINPSFYTLLLMLLDWHSQLIIYRVLRRLSRQAKHYLNPGMSRPALSLKSVGREAVHYPALLDSTEAARAV